MNTGQIMKEKTTRDFTILRNEVLNCDSLSMQAKGLFAYLMMLPEDWVIYKNELSKHFKNGRVAVYSAFKELQSHGLILSVQRRDSKGKLKGYDHIVYNSFQKTLNQQNKPEVHKPASGLPGAGKPVYGQSTSTKYLSKERTNYTKVDSENFSKTEDSPETEIEDNSPPAKLNQPKWKTN